MLPPTLLGLLVVLLATPGLAAPSKDTYDESLLVQSLPDGKVHSSFSFTLGGPWHQEGLTMGSNARAQHHSLLPPQLTSLIKHYRISSFSLTLSSGRWDTSWPLVSRGGTATTPSSGIELYAWLELLEGEEAGDEDTRWEGFQGALGGLFCAGIAAEGGNSYETPLWAYPFEGVGSPEEHKFYRTVLPRLSATCTESLTPFLGLLPCSSHAGLSSLLNPHKLFDGDWTYLGVHFSKGDEGGELRLEVGSVGDPVRSDRFNGGPGRRDVSTMQLYERSLKKACPVARVSEIKVVIPVDSVTPFKIEPSAGMVVRVDDGIELAVWDTTSVGPEGMEEVQVRWESETQFRHPLPSTLVLAAISTRRILTGYGQERGQIGIEVTNNLDRVVEVLWVETWPWWVRGFISSLSATAEPALADEGVQLIRNLSYSPPIPRKRPTTLQALLSLPPRSTARYMIDYEASYLWYTEYPSDASRGLEVPGAVVILLSPPSADVASFIGDDFTQRSHQLRLHTPSMLLSVPTPDFSMPYNVIILTSTLLALFFGSVVNGLVRTWVVVDVSPTAPEVGAAGGDDKADATALAQIVGLGAADGQEDGGTRMGGEDKGQVVNRSSKASVGGQDVAS